MMFMLLNVYKSWRSRGSGKFRFLTQTKDIFHPLRFISSEGESVEVAVFEVHPIESEIEGKLNWSETANGSALDAPSIPANIVGHRRRYRLMIADVFQTDIRLGIHKAQKLLNVVIAERTGCTAHVGDLLSRCICEMVG